MMNKLTRLWDKFLTWLWWPALKEAIENKKRGRAMNNEQSVYEALRVAINEAPDTGHYHNFAKEYMELALNDPDTGEPMTGEKLERQVLYALVNLTEWNSGRAGEIKAILRSNLEGL